MLPINVLVVSSPQKLYHNVTHVSKCNNDDDNHNYVIIHFHAIRRPTTSGCALFLNPFRLMLGILIATPSPSIRDIEEYRHFSTFQ